MPRRGLTRTALLLALPLLFVACASAAPGGSGGGAGVSSPSAPTSPAPSAPDDGTVTSPPDMGAIPTDPPPVEPEPGLVDVHPVTFEGVDVSADGLTLTIRWYGGVDACYGLADVQVERQDDGTLAIGLWEGTRPEAVGQACIEIAQLKTTVVILDSPVVVPLISR